MTGCSLREKKFSVSLQSGIAEEKGKKIGYEILVQDFHSHKIIANLTATSRQTVTTILNELRTNNLITFNRQRLLIRDLDKLRKEL